MESDKSSFVLLSVVAIVAIVALVVLVLGGTTNMVSQPEDTIGYAVASPNNPNPMYGAGFGRSSGIPQPNPGVNAVPACGAPCFHAGSACEPTSRGEPCSCKELTIKYVIETSETIHAPLEEYPVMAIESNGKKCLPEGASTVTYRKHGGGFFKPAPFNPENPNPIDDGR